MAPHNYIMPIALPLYNNVTHVCFCCVALHIVGPVFKGVVIAKPPPPPLQTGSEY